MTEDYSKKEEQLQQRLEKLKALERELKEKEKAVRAKEKSLKEKDKAKKQMVLRLSPTLWNEIAAPGQKRTFAPSTGRWNTC